MNARGIPADALMLSGGVADVGEKDGPGNVGIGFCEADEYPAQALEAAENVINSFAFVVVDASFGDARRHRRHGPREAETRIRHFSTTPDTGNRSGGTASSDGPSVPEGSPAPFGTDSAGDRPAPDIPMTSVGILQWQFHRDAYFGFTWPGAVGPRFRGVCPDRPRPPRSAHRDGGRRDGWRPI